MESNNTRTCTNCGAALTREEIYGGKCYHCGSKLSGDIAFTIPPIATILKILSVVILIGGTIGAICFANVTTYSYRYSSFDTDTEFSVILFLVYEIIAIVSSAAWYGFGEIISLLQKIKNNSNLLNEIKYSTNEIKDSMNEIKNNTGI